MSLEQEISDYLREAAQKSPMLLEALVHGDDHTVDVKTTLLSILEFVNAERNALVRLAGEIDELRSVLDGSS